MRHIACSLIRLTVTCTALTVSRHALSDGPKPQATPTRTAWTTSHVQGSPDPGPPYQLVNAFPSLSFAQPTVLTPGPTGERWYVAELGGKVYSFPNNPEARSADCTIFLDLTAVHDRVQHLYGLTFVPSAGAPRHVYVCYLVGDGYVGEARVSRFTVTDSDPPACDNGSEKQVFSWSTGGHNGGCIKFGPDGYLYIATGDGSAPSPPDQLNTGQDISDVLSSILRIDVSEQADGRPYAIPRDNPFIGVEGARPEVWAYGLRNPWKMTFDSSTGTLWVGDVGWDMWEMVFRIQRGSNCGWSILEGGQSIRSDVKAGPTPLELPVISLSHGDCRSISGGYVYRGHAYPELSGAYIYGDYVTGTLWGLWCTGGQLDKNRVLADSRRPIIGFAEDRDGELYVLDFGKRPPLQTSDNGVVCRLVRRGAPEQAVSFPRKLSETGLYTSLSAGEAAPGVVPYHIAATPWADGAATTRAIGIPGTGSIRPLDDPRTRSGVPGRRLNFPSDTVLVKTLSLRLSRQGHAADDTLTPVETQLLHLDGDVWRPYTYAWNDEATDAILVPAEGSLRELQVVDRDSPETTHVQTWRCHSRSECLVCHNRAAGVILGFTRDQLNVGEGGGDARHSCFDRIRQMGLIDGDVESDATTLVSPYDTVAPLTTRIRSYLDVNCSHCHGNGGGGTTALRLQRGVTISDMRIIDAGPTQGDFGISDARLVAPGEPFRSVLYYRLATLGHGRMPYVGSRVLDESALLLFHDWISTLVRAPGPAISNNERPCEVGPSVTTSAPREAASVTVEGMRTALETTEGALRVQSAIISGSVTSDAAKQLAEAGLQSAQTSVAALFYQFVPEDRRPQQTHISSSEILSTTGDLTRGRRLFFDDNGYRCSGCHRCESRGATLGPDLSGIGHASNRTELLTSLLEPSKRIEPKYALWTVVTDDGAVHTGLLLEKTGTHVTISNSAGITQIPAAAVDELIAQRLSMMPDNMLANASRQDIADLLAYLSAQK